MQKQITVLVTTALTLEVEDENLTEEKVQSMVDSTISNMNYEFSIDTNNGIVGNIVETEIIEHTITSVVNL